MLAGVLLAAVCRSQASELVLTEEDNGLTRSAIIAQSISVQLRGNATTGYLWSLTGTNGSSVSVAGPSSYVPDEPGRVGAGGVFIFPFVAASVGSTTLSVSYAKPWEPNDLAQTFAVTISVTESGTQPRLVVVLRNSTVFISWPVAGSSGFYLEGTRTMSTGWAALNVVAVADGSNYTVTLPVSGQCLFFRLRQQRLLF